MFKFKGPSQERPSQPRYASLTTGFMIGKEFDSVVALCQFKKKQECFVLFTTTAYSGRCIYLNCAIEVQLLIVG